MALCTQVWLDSFAEDQFACGREMAEEAEMCDQCLEEHRQLLIYLEACPREEMALEEARALCEQGYMSLPDFDRFYALIDQAVVIDVEELQVMEDERCGGVVQFPDAVQFAYESQMSFGMMVGYRFVKREVQ